MDRSVNVEVGAASGEGEEDLYSHVMTPVSALGQDMTKWSKNLMTSIKTTHRKLKTMLQRSVNVIGLPRAVEGRHASAASCTEEVDVVKSHFDHLKKAPGCISSSQTQPLRENQISTSSTNIFAAPKRQECELDRIN